MFPTIRPPFAVEAGKALWHNCPIPMIETPEGPTSEEREREITFETAARELISKGLRLHGEAHDPGGADPKIYHALEHPRGMEVRGERMADVLHLSLKERLVASLGIAWHDYILNYDEADPNKVTAMIRRHRGAREGDKPMGAQGNAGLSAERLKEEMQKVNRDAGRDIFTKEEIETAVWAIDTTYPDANLGPDFKGAPFENYPYYEVATEQNPALHEALGELKEQGIVKGPLFSQPHLEKPLEEGVKVPREVLIVALTDLGGVGFMEREEFFEEGDKEMRELLGNLRRHEVIQRLKEGDEERDRADREEVIGAFLSWLESQTGFAAWQALRFEKIMHLLKQQNGISPEEEEGLRKQFSHYEDNIRATRDRAKELRAKVAEITSSAGEKEAFLFLARGMHYEI